LANKRIYALSAPDCTGIAGPYTRDYTSSNFIKFCSLYILRHRKAFFLKTAYIFGMCNNK